MDHSFGYKLILFAEHLAISGLPLSTGKSIEGEVLDLGKLIKNEKNGRQTQTYECIADNGIGDALRKSITISYNGEWCESH